MSHFYASVRQRMEPDAVCFVVVRLYVRPCVVQKRLSSTGRRLVVYFRLPYMRSEAKDK